MRTLDEALELVAPSFPSLDAAREDEAQRRVAEMHARYADIAVEVSANENFAMMRTAITFTLTSGKVGFNDAMLTLFMLGLQTGVEMEKGDPLAPIGKRPWWKIWGRR